MEQALEIPPDLLVGHWRAVQGPFTIDWIFQGDRTFTGTAAHRGETISEFTGSWVLEGTWLYSHYTSDSLGAIEAGSNDRDVFLEFDYNHFVIQTSRGKRRYEMWHRPGQTLEMRAIYYSLRAVFAHQVRAVRFQSVPEHF